VATEIALTDDGERTLREAENLCWHTNVAIIAPEHLLGAALIVLHGLGNTDLPAPERVEAAVEATCGIGSEGLSDNVRFGSAARAALNDTARAVVESGAGIIDAATIARGMIDSGEVNPMLFGELGVARADLADLLG
jgi:hypothetical protein